MSSLSNNLCLCKDTDAEVELISLTFEKLPRYKLKADCNIQFSGYQHSDFKLAEQVREEITELSNEQIEKTLEYFLLCGLRVCKMTETYEDCAALRLLVEEQKAHMDEAANIGLNLLQRNIQLEQRLNTVEDQLAASKDTINQLKHQLHLKDDLLRLLHNEIEEAEDTSAAAAAAAAAVNHTDTHSGDSSFSLEKINLKALESKLSKLEEENVKLRNHQINLNSHTDFLESKEQQLIDDCVRQLLDSTKTVERLSSDLNKKTNDYLNQHEEISRLLTTNIDLDNKIHQLLTENGNLVTQLRDQQIKQFTLTKELTELRDRYDECINLLNERQDHIRQLKKKYKREVIKQVQGYRSGSPDINFAPSLAMEFEDSNRKELIIAEQSRAMRVMDQARTINSTWVDVDETSSGFTEDLSCSMINTEMDVSVQELSGGNYLLRKSIQEDCEKRRILKTNPSDLTTQIDSQMEESSTSTVASYCTLEAYRHHQNRCQNIRTLNTNILNSEHSPMHSHNIYKFPDKLQLVKPIEGSQTLRTWQNLATPSITKALFEEQSHSVCFRGQQPTLFSPSPSSPNSEHSHSSGIQHSLHSSLMSSDYDDVDYDEPVPYIQSKTPSSTGSSTYTYTNSRMMHPTSDPMQNNGIYNNSGNPVTTNQRRDTTSTFSLSFDLAKSLNERGTTKTGCDYQDSTPVNELNLEIPSDNIQPSSSRFTQSMHTGIDSSLTSQRTMPSWLDRLTVKSIMSSILGYPLPHLHRAIAGASYNTLNMNHGSIVSTTISSSPSSSSIIGRLTNLPPLAQRRYPQSGLNLLTSMAASSSQDRIIHRIVNIGDLPESESSTDDSSPKSTDLQLD